MKKIIFTVLFTLLICSVSCRKEGDYFMNPNDYVNRNSLNNRTAVGLFEDVWSSINTGYVFWDITDVDWDQRYLEYKPKFEELDSKDYGYAEVYQFLDELQDLFDGLLSGLKDGHMTVMAGLDSRFCIQSQPSRKTNEDRLHDDLNGAEFRRTFLADLAKNPAVSDFDSCHFIYDASLNTAGHATCVYTLSNGLKVPYLWNSDFVLESDISNLILAGQDPELSQNALKWQQIYDAFLDNMINTPKNELGGVILDLRTNGGGALNSLHNYINIFTGESKVYWETRYKEGMGRYDMSAWVPFVMHMPERHRDLAAEDIPLVLLCDVNTLSCAEITTGSIKQMPTAHVIGERTWGGQGPLSGMDNKLFNETYGGVSGSVDMSLGFWVYTSNYENRIAGGPCLEGIGITPHEEVLYKDAGYQGQFDAAIRYLESIQ